MSQCGAIAIFAMSDMVFIICCGKCDAVMWSLLSFVFYLLQLLTAAMCAVTMCTYGMYYTATLYNVCFFCVWNKCERMHQLIFLLDTGASAHKNQHRIHRNQWQCCLFDRIECFFFSNFYMFFFFSFNAYSLLWPIMRFSSVSPNKKRHDQHQRWWQCD